MKQNSIYWLLHASALILLPMAAEAFNRQQLLCLVNGPRVKAGLKPLLEDSVLNSTADQVCSTQAKSQAKTPPPSDEALLSEVNLNGYQQWVTVGQAVTSGARNEAECVKKWMADEKTRARLMDPKVTRWGGSVIYNNGVAYWTAMVGDSGVPAEGDVPECPVGENVVVEGEPGTGTNTTTAPKPVSPELVSGNPLADMKGADSPAQVQPGGAEADITGSTPVQPTIPGKAGAPPPTTPSAAQAEEPTVSILPVNPSPVLPNDMASGVAPSMGDKPATEPAVPSLPGSSASTRNPAGPPTGNAPPTPSLIDAAVPPPETQPGYKPAPGMMQEQPAAAYGANSPGNDAGAVASSSGGKPAGKQADATISFNVDESMLTPPKNAAGPSQGATGPNGAVIPSQDAIAPNNAAIPPTAGPNGATGPSQGTNTPNGAVVPPTAGPSGAAPPSYGATAPTDATDSSYGDTNSPTAGPTGATAPSKGATAPSKGAAAPTDTKTPPINIDDDTMYDTGVTAPAANKTSPGSVAPSADDKTPKSTAPSADDKASEPSPKSSSKSTSQVPEGEYLDINEPILKSPSKHKKKGGKYAACKELHGKERKECRKHTREAIKEAKKKSKEEEKSEPKEEYSAYGAAAY